MVTPAGRRLSLGPEYAGGPEPVEIRFVTVYEDADGQMVESPLDRPDIKRPHDAERVQRGTRVINLNKGVG